MASLTGARALIGRCVPGARTPYLPFQEAFAGLDTKPFVDAKSGQRVMRSLTKNEQVLFSTFELLRMVLAERPMILRLEDL